MSRKGQRLLAVRCRLRAAACRRGALAVSLRNRWLMRRSPAALPKSPPASGSTRKRSPSSSRACNARSTRATFRRASSRSRATGSWSSGSRWVTPRRSRVTSSSRRRSRSSRPSIWMLMGEGAIDVSTPRRRAHPRVRGQRQGRDHDRAGAAAHVGLPARAVRGRRLGRSRAPAGALREVAVQLGAGHALRVPPDVGALGAGRADRAGDGLRLPRLHPHAASSSRSACRDCSSACRSPSRATSTRSSRTGAPATPDELEAVLGVRELPMTEVTTDALLDFNQPGSVRGRRTRRRRRLDRGRSRALLPSAAARPARDVEARGARPTSRRRCATRSPTTWGRRPTARADSS